MLSMPYLLAAVGLLIAVWQQVGNSVTANPTLLVASGMIIALFVRQLLLLADNQRLIGRLEDQEALLHRQVDTLAHQALHDGLTGLANRRLFYDELNRAVAVHRRNGRPVAVLMCDLDNLKTINDTLGHGAGDDLLVRVAQSLGAATRAGDTLARLGGDEFAILLEDGGNPYDVVERVRNAIEVGTSDSGQAIPTGLSIGVAVIEDGGGVTNADDLVMHADLAMYEDKEARKAARGSASPAEHTSTVGDATAKDPGPPAR